MPKPTIKELEGQVNRYKELWLSVLGKKHDCEVKIEEMRSIIIELYYSSYWDSDRLQSDTACHIWQKVKETFKLTESGPVRIKLNDPKIGD